ncbi:hypothetical protein [Natrinema salinisoli]|uniref:hypothetical protein n=1 Tax=Natrinema salinisoli TaxID=2878535 RepID=UPI001CEFEF55|nr:hypothetical protein [Natrinema salinisoli]
MGKNLEREHLVSECADQISDAADRLQECKEMAHPYQPDPEARLWISEEGARLDAWKEVLDDVLAAYSEDGGAAELQRLFFRRSYLYHVFAEEQRKETGRGSLFRRFDMSESVFSRAVSIVKEATGLEPLDEDERRRIRNSVRRSRGKPVIESEGDNVAN